MAPRRPKLDLGSALDNRADADMDVAAGDARGKPIRVTVELERPEYRELSEWAAQAIAARADLSRVPLAEAFRAMMRVTLADPDVTARVQGEIRVKRSR